MTWGIYDKHGVLLGAPFKTRADALRAIPRSCELEWKAVQLTEDDLKRAAKAEGKSWPPNGSEQ